MGERRPTVPPLQERTVMQSMTGGEAGRAGAQDSMGIPYLPEVIQTFKIYSFSVWNCLENSILPTKRKNGAARVGSSV